MKSGRWRGAVWIDPADGQPWLVDAGIRREESDTDFYAQFLGAIAFEGAKPFLPSDEDHTRLRLEIASKRVHEWELRLYLDTVATLLGGSRDGYGAPLDRERVRRRPSSRARDRSGALPEWDDDDPVEVPAGVAVHFRVNDWSDPGVLTSAQVIACSAISPFEQDWDVAPEAVGARMMASSSGLWSMVANIRPGSE